ncbi:MAG TPA: tRNA-dihydrouridine synthase family protein [Candidatus Paceibacterota bacterium]|nr:tRNA-dihydrouridine synthase family protein [Candidatus Paceibacterota bacterium]
MNTFWQTLAKPFFVMAPMADVTDVAFRALVEKRGAPDVFWTEFVSADGLYHTRPIRDQESILPSTGVSNGTSEIQRIEGHRSLLRDLQFAPNQHPIVAQIFSSEPSMISYATKLVAELGFDGVDLNMGCPDRSIEKQGCGSAMMKTPEVARAVIRAAKEASALPVSVKTRVGYNKESLEEWLPVLLEESPVAITLHLRTRKDMSLVPADWGYMKKAVEIRNRLNPNVLLIGNGDLTDLADAREKVAQSGCDGAMIGRGMFGNPWVFAGRKPEETPLAEKLAALVELAYGFEKISPPKNFSILKKHIKAFVTGFDGAARLRALVMEAENAAELERILHENQL